MSKYRAHLEFDAPDDMTAWLMGQRFARNAGTECVLANIEAEKRYFTDVSRPEGPGFEDVRAARAGVMSEIPF